MLTPACANDAYIMIGHTQCNIFLDSDVTFFNQHKGGCALDWSEAVCLARYGNMMTHTNF